MIRFEENMDKCRTEWQALQEKSEYFSYFQSVDCYDFYKKFDGMSPFAFGVFQDDELAGVVVGYVTVEKNKLKQCFTKRAIIISGPMLHPSITGDALEALLRGTTEQLRKNSIYIETRNFFDYGKYLGIFEKCGFAYEEHLNFKVDTSSKEIVEKNVSKNIKRDVRTTLREGARIVEHPDKEQVRQYYDLLLDLYKTKVKTPLFPLSFFETLHESGSSYFLLVEYNGRIVGGTVCVGLGGRMYEWFVCGEDRKYKHVFPSLLATYSALEYCADHGFVVFDMMGAGKPGDGYGVRDFKARFGGQLVEEGRFVHVGHKLLFALGKFGVKLLKRF